MIGPLEFEETMFLSEVGTCQGRSPKHVGFPLNLVASAENRTSKKALYRYVKCCKAPGTHLDQKFPWRRVCFEVVSSPTSTGLGYLPSALQDHVVNQVYNE